MCLCIISRPPCKEPCWVMVSLAFSVFLLMSLKTTGYPYVNEFPLFMRHERPSRLSNCESISY